MIKKVFLSALLLCLTAFGPASANDPIDRLAEEGWETVRPGVMQRTLENGTIETLGFGADGLRFRLEELKARLGVLRQEFALQPSRELRQAIRAQRAEILRTQATLRKAEADGGLEPAHEALVATGLNCSANYDAIVAAQPGSARAESYFNNVCDYTGEVYANASASATSADNVVTNSYKYDPAPNAPRIGTAVTASAAASASGVQSCYSYAYASVTSYDLDPVITYSQTAESRECPQRQVSISNPAAGSLQISPVRVVASATSPAPIIRLQVYLDGTKVHEVHEGQLAADIPMAPGSRRLTVQAYDAAGSFKTTQYIDVCALNPASPSVTICAPADGTTVSSPVRVLAGTTSARPVKLVQIYLDGSKIYEEASHRLDRSLTLSPGTHRLTVQAYDDLGGIFKSTVYLTVP